MLPIREFVTFFLLQFISYSNLVLNIRAIDNRQLEIAVVTDGLAGLLAWVMVKKIGQAQGKSGMIGAILGGMLATWVTMHLTWGWND